MKRFVHLILAGALALALGLCGFGCGSGVNYAEPKSENQTINLFLSTYTTSKNFSPAELHLNNDGSAWIRYQYTASDRTADKIAAALEDLVETLNKKIYSDSAYREGYRMFYCGEGDVDAAQGTATMHMVKLAAVNKSYYKQLTVAEYIEEKGTSSEAVFEVRPTDNSEGKYSLVNASDKDKERLKVWQLKNLTEGLAVSFEGTPLYFYDDGKASVTKTEAGALMFSQKDEVAVVYQEKAPVDVVALSVGIGAGVLVLAAGVILYLTLRKRHH